MIVLVVLSLTLCTIAFIYLIIVGDRVNATLPSIHQKSNTDIVTVRPLPNPLVHHHATPSLDFVTSLVFRCRRCGRSHRPFCSPNSILTEDEHIEHSEFPTPNAYVP